MTAVVAPARRLIIGVALLFLLAGAEPASAGTPILVVESPSNRFSSYVPEILRAEGLNGFTRADLSTVSPALLAAHDVVVLGDVPITPDQANAFAGWVTAGGNLIALSPDPQLAPLLGIAPTGGQLANAYLGINTAAPPGAGIVRETIQFHGTADRYVLTGAGAVAMLHENASTASANPAVTLRGVGTTGGEAAAFTFDLARSVVYTRQGNPAWAGLDRDPFAPIRTNDLFYGSATEPNWVDLEKIGIPQADELQRLLANLITHMNRDRTPVPRFWYLPRDERAAVVLTGDDHGRGGTRERFDEHVARSPGNCSVAAWECVRSTSYIYAVPASIDPEVAADYQQRGFEISIHPHDGSGCSDPSEQELAAAYDEQLSGLAASFPRIAPPLTARFHCVSWPDWATHARVEAGRGIRLDANYYHYPPSWGGLPGYMTGSGEIMRFADADGSPINLYQAHTHVNDEWAARDDSSLSTAAINSLLTWATDAHGYYGLFTVNMHTDDDRSAAGSAAIVQRAQELGVPIISARQALGWVEGRDNSSFTDFTWGAGRLAFTINAAPGANGLQGMVPIHSATGAILGLTRDGAEVPLTAQTIKGVEYAVFPAAGGRYEARYPFPVASSTSGPGGKAVLPTTNDRTAPRLRLRLPRRITLRRLLRKGLSYRLTCTEPCRVRVRLVMKLRRRTVPVASSRRKLGGDRGVRVVLKPGRKAARKLRRARPTRLTLRIRVADRFGNARVVTRRIRLIS